MRGVPTRPVRCNGCESNRGCSKDSLCHSCRILARPNPNKKYDWTPELEGILRRAYHSARTRKELTASLTHMQRMTGFSRGSLLTKAGSLNLSFGSKRAWTSAEREFLRDNAGSITATAISRHLGRTHYSVKAQASCQQLSLRFQEGYTQDDLRELLGVGIKRIRVWIQKGWVKVNNGRIVESSVVRFLRQHPEEYVLRRVDEAWFKGLIFPSFGQSPMARSIQSEQTYSIPITVVENVTEQGI